MIKPNRKRLSLNLALRALACRWALPSARPWTTAFP